MLINQLLELYNGLLTSICVCYMIYRLNKDLKRAPFLSYIFSCVVITMAVFLLHFMLPGMDRSIMLITDILIVTFVIKFFYKYNIYCSLFTAFFVTLLLGFADVFVAIVYAFPLKLTLQEFRTSFIHISVGSALMYLFIIALLKLVANNFIATRKRIYKKYNKFVILLSVNLSAVFVILLFIYNMFTYYLDYPGINYRNNTEYYRFILICIALIASIVGTIYFINHLIFNNLKYDKLKMLQVKDAMTDTLNRGSGVSFIEEQLEICRKSNKGLTICYVDINDLKVINDRLGHKRGDELIKAIVEAIKDNIRETDEICRLGGDEFVIVFPGCDIEYGKKVMGRISDKVKHMRLFNSEQYTISISYGFSEYGGDCEITVDALLDQADHQMYLNKKAIKAMGC